MSSVQGHLETASQLLLTPFGLDEQHLQKVLSSIFTHKVDYADLYFSSPGARAGVWRRVSSRPAVSQLIRVSVYVRFRAKRQRLHTLMKFLCRR
jgi:hypothetical protein